MIVPRIIARALRYSCVHRPQRRVLPGRGRRGRGVGVELDAIDRPPARRV